MLAVDVAPIIDIAPGAADTSPSGLVEFNGLILFNADDGIHGRELWKSDGTAIGTHLVKDIFSGPSSSHANGFINANGTLYFFADDGENGTELWKSDGTEAGTWLVKNIRSGSADSQGRYLTLANGRLFFSANDGENGQELWTSDGTSDGTVMLKNISSNGSSSNPRFLTEVNGNLYFVASDSVSGFEIWRSEGTTESTIQVTNFNAPAEQLTAGYLTNLNGTLYFTGFNEDSGNELWKSDGSFSGTSQVKEIFPGLESSSPSLLTNVAGTLFFQATDGIHGYELWKSDGSEAGTTLVKDISVGPDSSSSTLFTNVGGRLYFQNADLSQGSNLWASDGTNDGTTLVREGLTPSSLHSGNGVLYLQASDGTRGSELWKSNGTAAGTALMEDIANGATSSSPQEFITIGELTYFVAGSPTFGRELYVLNLAPRDILFSSLEINENAGVNAEIAIISTSDPNRNDAFQYELVNGSGDTDNSVFQILGNKLVARNSFDFETKRSYSLRIRSTDSKGLAVEESIVIQILDEPEGTIRNDAFLLTASSSGLNVVQGNTNLGMFPHSQSIRIHGKSGIDSLRFVGRSMSDTVSLTSSGFVFNGMQIILDSIENLTIDAGGGADTVHFETRPIGVGSLVLKGGMGDDRYSSSIDAQLGVITFEELTEGNDTLDFSTATVPLRVDLSYAATQIVSPNLTINLRSNRTIENVIGGHASDTLIGNTKNNRLRGGDGDDILDGGGGNDTYLFDLDEPQGSDTIVDMSGRENLDFSESQSVGATLDISTSQTQGVAASLLLTIIREQSIENVFGTDVADSVKGNILNNRLEGRGGDDLLSGGIGNDFYAFDSDSSLGHDTLDDSSGIETLDFTASSDMGVRVDLSIAAMQVLNSNLSLTLSSSLSFENILGSQSNDVLSGNSRANILTGGKGQDLLAGGSGNDTYPFNTNSSLGADTIDDSEGIDTISFAQSTVGSGAELSLELTTTQLVNSNLTLTLTSSDSIENIIGSPLSDRLTGNALNNNILGHAGNDYLNGGAGNDIYPFDGDLSLGLDTLEDPSGIDTITFSATTFKLVQVDLSKTEAQAITNSLMLTISDSSSIENVVGGQLGGTIIGNSLANTFVGGPGNDTFIGRDGDDVYSFDADIISGSDTIIEMGLGIDTINFASTMSSGIHLDLARETLQTVRTGYLAITLTPGSSIEKVIGTNLADTIIGNSLSNILLGGGGDDVIRGGSGRDILIGGIGGDTLDGEEDDDLIISGTTTHDLNSFALSQIHLEWTSTNSYLTRVNNLRTGSMILPSLVPTQSVKKDRNSNLLIGNIGRDWYFANLAPPNDILNDQVVNELKEEL